jgi:hypothetical protein
MTHSITTTSVRPTAVVTFCDQPATPTTAFANIAQLAAEFGLPQAAVARATADLYDALTRFYIRRAGGELQ